MANLSRRTVYYIQQRLHSPKIPSKPISQNPFTFTTTDPSSNLSRFYQNSHYSTLITKPTSLNGLFSRLLSKNYNSFTRNHNLFNRFSYSRHFRTKIPVKLQPLGSGIRGLGRFANRSFSIKSFSSPKFGSNLGKSAIQKPVNAVKSTIFKYREAVGLQIEAFWKRNYMVLVGAGALVLCIILWRVMFSIADMTVGISEGLAKYGFLALATAIVAFAIMYLRARFTINPDKVYRMAMRKLNTSPSILEVMGAPLTGTEVRAYVMSGGGPKLKDFKLKLGGKRCFLIFPIRGSERRGLVSVEVKKKKGQYDMKLLAVDIPMLTGPDQRLFLIGDEKEYRVGGGLISELRDPIVTAMAAEKEFDILDEREEQEDELREREEAERKQREEEERALEEERERQIEREREREIEREREKASS